MVLTVLYYEKDLVLEFGFSQMNLGVWRILALELVTCIHIVYVGIIFLSTLF